MEIAKTKRMLVAKQTPVLKNISILGNRKLIAAKTIMQLWNNRIPNINK
jgi:hypothetical protein